MTTESAEKKPTVRRRRRAARSGKGGMPRIMWLAILVCVAGAVALFRSGGGGPMPTGLGEKRTVVTAPEGGEPVSGDVEIAGEGLQLTPEQPVAGHDLGGADNAPLEVTVSRPLAGDDADQAAANAANAAGAAGAETTEATAAGAATPTPPADAEAPAAKPATTVPESRREVEAEEPDRPEPTGALPARVVPQPRGPYLVQVGSFGDNENAQKEAGRLRPFGWDATVRVGNKADGGLVYRVQIGYFATREDAQAFIDQNHARLPGAIPAHR